MCASAHVGVGAGVHTCACVYGSTGHDIPFLAKGSSEPPCGLSVSHGAKSVTGITMTAILSPDDKCQFLGLGILPTSLLIGCPQLNPPLPNPAE